MTSCSPGLIDFVGTTMTYIDAELDKHIWSWLSEPSGLPRIYDAPAVTITECSYKRVSHHRAFCGHKFKLGGQTT